MDKQSTKKVLQSIFVGACVAFLSTLFSEIAMFIKTHATELTSGGVTAFYHLTKNFKA